MKNKIILIIAVVLLAQAAFAQFLAIDPTERCLNARVIGLGRTFVGLANDASAIYINPAGLARLSNWEITSLSGKFLEDYNYLSLSGFYPTPYGIFGLGFGGYSIAGAYATRVVDGSDPNDPIYEIDPTQPQIQNANYVYSLTYASKLDRFYRGFKWSDKLSLGANVKMFNTGLSGDSITNGNATGYQLDLGLLYAPNDTYSLGAALQNALPASMGGVLTYTSGHKEGFPHVLKAGGAVKLLGNSGGILKMLGQELTVLGDVYYQLNVSKTLPAYHLGAEWYPIPMIAVRAGIDQEIEGDGTGTSIQTVNNIASGVGLRYGGFRFDYGYHSYVTMPGVSNNFFSLSYSLTPPPAEYKDKLVIDEPQDKLVTFADKVKVAGNVLDPSIKSLFIKGSQVKYGLKGDFETQVNLMTGKNSIEVKVYDVKDKLLQTNKLRILRLVTFPDVPLAYWVDKPISLLAMAGIITGYPNGNFIPEGNITRAEMCSLLMKARQPALTPKSPLPEGEGTFRDVSAKHWAADFIAQAAAQGVVKGYPGNLFKPNGKITRAEGLAMIARFAGISDEVYARQFADLEASHWVASIAAGAYKAGLLEYLKGKNFEPNRQLTRAETVEMLQRTEVVQAILNKDLLDWDSY